MHQPMKQLPERAISEEEAREILHDAEYCVVATVDEDGHPYATPLSYALDKVSGKAGRRVPNGKGAVSHH